MRTIGLVLAGGCVGVSTDDDKPAAIVTPAWVAVDSGTATTPTYGGSTDSGADTDTGWTTPWVPECPVQPCAYDVADARFTAAVPEQIGYALGVAGDTVLAAATTAHNGEGPGEPPDDPRLYVLEADFAGADSFVGADYGDQIGAAVAAADLDGDGELEVAISAPGERTADYMGVVYLVSALPTGEVELGDTVATASFRADDHAGLFGTAFLELDTGGLQWIVAGGGELGGCGDLGPGVVYGLDPAASGALGPEDALWTVTGAATFGWSAIGWDGDGDGIDDLVTPDAGHAAVRFASPLVAVVSDDAETRWTSDPLWSNFVPMANVGDVTGDGAPDLAMADHAHSGPVPPAMCGAVYVVEGGDIADHDASEIPLQWLCSSVDDDHWGWAVAAGDVDGDGQRDLVFTAPQPDGTAPGRVVGLLGPVTSLDPAGAAFVVYGTDEDAWFGAAVLVHDGDHDGRDDLYVGASREEHLQGAVYRFLGAQLVR